MKLTDETAGRVAQRLRPRLGTIGASDVYAYRARHPMCDASYEDVRLLVLAEHPNDLGFSPRSSTRAHKSY